jgi:uncharacterized protein (TIGR00369 family)
MLRGDAPPPPVATLVGFALVSFAPGRAVFAMEARPEHGNPFGTVQGGILCTLADAAMGTAYVAGLAEGESMTTLEVKMNFLRPLRRGRVTAVADVIKQGQRVGLVECTISDDQGRLVARASSTCLTIRKAEEGTPVPEEGTPVPEEGER